MHELQLDERQRAFIPVDGCAENVMLLATMIDEARRSHKPLAMASIDIAKAFDKVAHLAILRGLKRKGVSEDFISYIRDFYATSSTVLTYGDRSLLVHPVAGVRQGDPLSPLLFNLVIDEFLDELSPNLAFRSEGLQISAMAFADDLILAASTEHGLREHISQLELFLEKRGLRANAGKSSSLVILPSGRDHKSKICADRKFSIHGEEMASQSCSSLWKYLGVTFSATGRIQGPIRHELAALLQRVTKAPLKPQQRLVILRYYLIPRLTHRLALGPISAKTLTAIDRSIRASVRKWLMFPHDVPLGFFYASVEQGGLGICCLRTTIPALRTKRFGKMMYSRYTACAFAATKKTVVDAKHQAERLCLFKGRMINSSKESVTYWDAQLHASADGRPLAGCKNAKGSTFWLREGTSFLRGKEFIDLAKFHIGAMPNLTRLKRGRDVSKRCRAGCDADESLGHILQRCHRTHHTRIQRHDHIVRYLSKRLKEQGWDVKVEPHYATSQGTRIPDLVIKRDCQALILDVQVVGTRVALSQAHEIKTAKYKIPDLLMSMMPRPTVSSVTLSYRGVWATQSVGVLKDIGLGANDFKLITVRCLQGGLHSFRTHQHMTSVRTE